jgi:hypothetical protein
MKRKILFALLLVSSLVVIAGSGGNAAPSAAGTGNGAPNGSHYTLNIIGVPQDKTADMTGNTGGRIFVQLNGGQDAVSLNGKPSNQLIKVNTIGLVPAPAGESFSVLDANATDANGGLFQLPADVSTAWTVWARALGTPGGSAIQTTCASSFLDVTVGQIYCSDVSAMYVRTTGKSTFTNVSSQLLFMTVTVDSTATPGLAACLNVTGTASVTVSLFNSCFQDYFWNYDNNGLKVLQLRFYAAS